MKKKMLLITFLILLIPFGFVLGRETEVTYPIIPGAIRPVTTRVLFTDYIKYAYNSIIVFSGLICFGTMIWAGSVYATSAGNPTKQKDARQRVLLAFVGCLIVLGSYLMANTINPQLINPSIGITPLGGVSLYSESNYGGEQRNFASDTSDLGLMPDGETPFIAKSMKFISEPSDLEIVLYENTKDNKGEEIPYTGGSDKVYGLATNYPSLTVNGRSIQFNWKLPGVYLCTGSYGGGQECNGTEKFLSSDTSTLDSDINDNIGSIRFKPRIIKSAQGGKDVKIGYGAILHEDANQEGKCGVFRSLSGSMGVSRGDKISSVTVFPIHEGTPIGGIKLCTEENFGGDCNNVSNDEIWNVSGKYKPSRKGVNSVKVEGSWIGILYKDKNGEGDCQVFRGDNWTLLDDPIGRCGCFLGNWGCHSCVESAQAFPIK